jgi:methylase of polypeptide subunit release factors
MHLASEILDGSLDKQMDRIREVNGLSQKSLGTPVRSKVKILDACSGSGCISLLLYNLLSDHIDVQIDGIDVSEKALNLSRRNLERNITRKGLKPDARSHVRFRDQNILSFTDSNKTQIWDEYNIIISNPPYISREEYDTQIPHSVRDWEPELALVPTISPGAGNHSDVHPADIFYKVLILMYQTTWRRNVMLVLEIGDEEQAKRVIAMAILKFKVDDHSIVRVWRDSPDIRPSGEHLEVEGRKIPTEGQGNVRAVVLVRERFQDDAMGVSSGVNT